jgi:multiple sugar transport system substrate-binding protein
MKSFIGLLACLLVASAVAWSIMPGADPSGRTRLIWVSDDNPARQETMRLFNETHRDCVVSLDPVYKAGMEKVIVQSTGGVGPDIFDCYGNYQLASFVQADVAWDITDELKKVGIDVEKECWPAIIPTAVNNGRVYGFPANVATDVLFFNKDIFDRMGIPLPTGPMRWDEFVPLAQKLTVKDSEGRIIQYGFSFDFNRWQDFLPQWGAHVFSDDGTRCALDSPQAIACARFEHDMIWKWKIMPNAAEEDASVQQGGYGNLAMKFLASKRAATVLGGRWWLTTMRQYTGIAVGACEAPHGPVYCFNAYGKATVINKHSPRREAALKFIAFMHTKEYNDQINQVADGMAPMPKYCTLASLVNPHYPGEDFHAVFPEEIKRGNIEPISPFVNNALASRLMDAQHDLMRRNAKTPEEAMREMTRQINAEIQKTLARDPELKKRYDALVKKSST